MNNFRKRLERHWRNAFQTLKTDVGLGGRIFLAAFASLSAISLSFIFTLYTQNQLSNLTHQMVSQQMRSMQAAYETKESFVSHNNAVLSFLATRNPRYLRDAKRLRQDAIVHVQTLRMTSFNNVIKGKVQRLQEAIKSYLNDASDLIELSKKEELPPNSSFWQAVVWARSQDKQREALAIISAEGQEQLSYIFSLCDEILTWNQAELVAAQDDIDEMFRRSLHRSILVVSIGGVIIFFIVIGLALSLLGALRALSDGLKKVGAGNFKIELPIKTAGELGRITTEFNRMAGTIQRQQEDLKRQSITDELTGIYNQRHFRTVLEMEFERARRRKGPLALLMIDVDHFKPYNDTYGHEAGNDLLKKISKTLQNQLRSIDILARYGGDEFSAILPNAEPKEAQQVANRLIEAIRRELFPGRAFEGIHPITLSIGGAAYPLNASSLNDLIKRADEALYVAKRGGKNKISWAMTIASPIIVQA